MPTLAQKYENDKQDINALAPNDLALDDNLSIADASSSSEAKKVAISRMISVYAPCQGRLTLESGVPCSTTNQTNKTSLYWTPYKGNNIALYDGTRWNLRTFSQQEFRLTVSGVCTTTNGQPTVTITTSPPPTPFSMVDLIVGMKINGTGIPANTTISLIDSLTQFTMNNNATADGTVSLTFQVVGSTVYDVVAFESGIPALVHLTLVPWTNVTTRANAITTQDGVYCLTNSVSIGSVSFSGAKLRYIGTIAAQSDGICYDSANYRYVFNMYNRLRRFGHTHNTTSSWTYGTQAWREANGGTGQVRFNFVIGMPIEIRALMGGWCVGASGGSYNGAGLDGTSIILWDVLSAAGPLVYGYYNANIRRIVTAGAHYCTQVEYSAATGTYYGQGSEATCGYQSMFVLEI